MSIFGIKGSIIYSELYIIIIIIITAHLTEGGYETPWGFSDFPKVTKLVSTSTVHWVVWPVICLLNSTYC